MALSVIGCAGFVISQSHFLFFVAASVFYQIFSKFLSEVLKCRGMSGIAFEADPLIFLLFPLWRHLDAILDFR